MLKYVEEAVWNDGKTLHSRKPMPDSVRILVRERARDACK
jgi:DNA helicase-2/ATP-dependent DNA helicase PcrA